MLIFNTSVIAKRKKNNQPTNKFYRINFNELYFSANHLVLNNRFSLYSFSEI